MIHGDWALWSFPLSLRDAHPRWSSQSPLPRALPPGHDGTHEGHGQAAESTGRATATPGACSRDPSSRGQLDTEPRETSSPLVIPRRAPRQTLTTAGGRAQALPQHSVRGDQGTAREGPSPCRGHTRHPPQRRAPPLSAPDDLAPLFLPSSPPVWSPTGNSSSSSKAARPGSHCLHPTTAFLGTSSAPGPRTVSERPRLHTVLTEQGQTRKTTSG